MKSIVFLSSKNFWTALAERSGDSAFERTGILLRPATFRPCESGVALRFPPQSKIVHFTNPLG